LLKQKNEPLIVEVNGGEMNVWNAGQKWIALDCNNVLEDDADNMVNSDVRFTGDILQGDPSELWGPML
jgi:hypothetical protein